MPQMNKGGKFIFGKSSVRPDLSVQLPPQAIAEYKITSEGILQLTQAMLQASSLSVGTQLLSIRSSDIAFCMGAKGPLLERSDNYAGELELY